MPDSDVPPTKGNPPDITSIPMDELLSTAEALTEQTRKGRQRPPASPQHPNRPLGLLMITLAVLIGSIILHFPQIRHPFHRPDQRQVSHAMRMEIVTAADYLDRWKEAHGKLPDTLPETLNAKEFITYTIDGDRYALAMGRGAIRLQYREGEEKMAFLKEALSY